VPANDRVAIRSLMEPDVPQSVKDDLVALSQAIIPPKSVWTGNPVLVGKSGTYRAFLVSRLTTENSDATDYHTISVTRNGVDGVSTRWDSVALPPTNEKEIGAFEAYFLGEFAAYIDDFVEAVPVVYGNPSPMLTASDIAIRLVEIDRGGFA
jgi:hypothetical protein